MLHRTRVYMFARAIVHMPLEMLLSYAEKPTIILELCCQDPVSFKSQSNSIKTLGRDQPPSSRRRTHVKLALALRILWKEDYVSSLRCVLV